jgi:hypothetical protein
MKSTLFVILTTTVIFCSCSGNEKKDETNSRDTTETTSGPAMKPGDRTSDGGH